jgi:hypothetical protein
MMRREKRDLFYVQSVIVIMFGRMVSLVTPVYRDINVRIVRELFNILRSLVVRNPERKARYYVQGVIVHIQRRME